MYLFYFYFMFIVKIKFFAVYGILGGNGVNISEAPYQANYADKCGAVLIQNKWALTTAHCGPDGTFIRVGSNHRLKGQKIQVLSHFIHPKYQLYHEFDFDVQLLKLYRVVRFSKLVGSIKICRGSYEGPLRVFGWGYSKERGEYNDILQRIEVQVITKQACQLVDLPWYNHTLTSNMFCAGGSGKDACQGDSGGAAVSKDCLGGLSSFGYGCGREIPGVYADLRHMAVRTWIARLAGV